MMHARTHARTHTDSRKLARAQGAEAARALLSDQSTDVGTAPCSHIIESGDVAEADLVHETERETEPVD